LFHFSPFQSQWPESDWRPHPYHGCALPTELHWPIDFGFKISDLLFSSQFIIVDPSLLFINHNTQIIFFLPSGRRGSNPRPSAWKADALPTELLPLVHESRYAYRDSR